ncbi:TPA: hypothetical protein QDB46_005259 [Burkholderia multivorans]|nr:hypothetical protein [Burkholderia multivorans]HDR9296076.1 hypothetical protein [Burkholderia multivorans]HDR9301627.1 hypothetical protein [Burkholderia multivorans]HDR9307136.1 hypothetical protein [Burkholderia multivorans]HDR9313318.1 hypothetical protein [Burkholderia multivorans]
MTRMFHAACHDLGLINEALGLDPDDGGAEPILDAIAELRAQIASAQTDEPVAWAVYNGWSRICFYMTEEDARDHAQKAQKNHDLSGSLAAFRVVPLYAAPQPARAATPDAEAVNWRELSRRLYVELFHCDQQMRSTRDEDGEPHWTQSAVVRDVLADAKAALDGAPQPAQADAPAEAREPHSDDVAVDSFAAAMKHKLALARAKGRGGWETCSPADLSRMLREHVEKGDPRDVANFCMMLWHHGSPIVSAPADARVAQADARVGLTDEQREAIEYAITRMDLNVSNRDAYTAAKELRALLNGADHAE